MLVQWTSQLCPFHIQSKNILGVQVFKLPFYQYTCTVVCMQYRPDTFAISHRLTDILYIPALHVNSLHKHNPTQATGQV